MCSYLSGYNGFYKFINTEQVQLVYVLESVATVSEFLSVYNIKYENKKYLIKIGLIQGQKPYAFDGCCYSIYNFECVWDSL